MGVVPQSSQVLSIHEMPVALALALPSAGRSRLAKIAITAMTTSSSMSVNAARKFGRRPTLSDGMVVGEFIGLFALKLFAATVVCWKPAIIGIDDTLERTGIRSSTKVVRRIEAGHD